MRKPSRIPSSENNVRESIARIDRKIKICGTDVVGQFDTVSFDGVIPKDRVFTSGPRDLGGTSPLSRRSLAPSEQRLRRLTPLRLLISN